METFHNNLLEILICPLCQSKLQLEIFSTERKDGIFFCENGHWYPMDNGLPIILVGQLRKGYSAFIELYRDQLALMRLTSNEKSYERGESKQVQETYREKWTSMDTMGISDSSPWKRFIRSWMLKKYGWGDESGFQKALSSRRMILDAGTGLGREVINMASAAKQSVVVGIEFSDCAVNALRNISGLTNAYIIQGDILRMPFREGSFDFVLSEGVLHHTPNPQEAFGKCCKVLRKGGEIAFYVYRKKGPAREFTDDYLREIVQKASTKEQWEFADRITKLGKALSRLNAEIDIPVDIPELEIRKGKISVHRFIYWNFLKCFWNDNLLYDENRLVNFDWFTPEHAYRLTEDEVRDWCRKCNVEITWFNREESGYTVKGVKRS